MTTWQPWNRAEAPEQLADYVQTDTTRLLLPAPLAQRLPAPGDGRSAQAKARVIYEVLSEAGTQYVHEPATSPKGGQAIRPPDQVLSRPKHGTCIDLALVYAGTCLDAGLRPMVVVVDSTAGLSSHALVVVWLDGQWTLNGDDECPFDGEFFVTPPRLDSGLSLIDALRESDASTGAFVAVDVQAMARSAHASPGSWNYALRQGHRVLATTAIAGGEWSWGFGIDVGQSRRLRPPCTPHAWSHDERQGLAQPYADPVEELSPLTQLKARSGKIPFLPRDELDLLLDWVDPSGDGTEQAATGDHSKASVRVVTGVGGSGKTHLAAELCRRLADQGWYTGFIPRPLRSSTPPSTSLRWLCEVVSPVLAVVDYADEFDKNYLTELLETLAAREQRTRVLLTARADGTWLSDVTRSLQERAVHVRLELPTPLTRRHPNVNRLFSLTFSRFVDDDRNADPSIRLPEQTNWTTLDVVMQAWLAANQSDHTEAPKTKEELYEEVLFDHEVPYWQHTIDNELRPPSWSTERTAVPGELADSGTNDATSFTLVPPETLATAGAALTLVAPTPDHVMEVLDRLGQRPSGEPSWGQIGHVLTRLLHESGEGVALRPDPVGEYLVLRQFTPKPRAHSTPGSPKQFNPELLEALLPKEPLPLAEPTTTLRREAFAEHTERVHEEFTRATLVVSRAAQLDRFWGSALAEECLAVNPHMWPQALSHTLRQGGVFAGALEKMLGTLTTLSTNPLPLELLAQLPTGHGALRGFALAAARALRPTLPEAPLPDDRERLAGWLNDYSVRLAETGDRAGALKAIDEAVTIRRQLAETNPAAFLPDLAGSLNNQANQRAEVGDRAGALEAIDVAVTISRQLAETNPAAFLPNLAMSLNNQAKQRSEAGDRAGALKAIDEAVTHYRQLTETNPAAFLPDLAVTLNTQAVVRSEVGDRAGALKAIDEAVTIRRQLAETNPAAFLPDLAMSLNNQATMISAVGERAGALQASDEAVTHYRQLAETNPAAFLPNLAGSLNNQATIRSAGGDLTAALQTIDEAVTIRRQLTETNPAAFLPDLAMSLNTQAVVRSEAGDRAGALKAIDEAVTHYRQLTETNPAAFLPDLAVTLNTQAVVRSEVGDRAGALKAIDEAVTIRRQLAE
ncbi:tetratricopeptide repeat protein, partial [Tessaracoccus caeni]|uniref:tetratricopeptide repeat protein n=1 Tax=Tessaracoccus caeni TaxID=3031239 RepID=UPI0023DB980A